jgi:hypothetical protein
VSDNNGHRCLTGVRTKDHGLVSEVLTPGSCRSSIIVTVILTRDGSHVPVAMSTVVLLLGCLPFGVGFVLADFAIVQ